MKSISIDKIWDYFILTVRFLLAWTFLRYGWGKLTGSQFGITEVEMVMQLKDISLFKLSWYLFGHEPFNTFVGVSQILCGLLLLLNRTVLFGAFLFLPIVTTILIIDLSFMPPPMAQGFAWRLSFYIFLDFLILWHYKQRMKNIWEALWENVSTRYKIPIWAYFLLPVGAIVLELAGTIPELLVQLITDPEATIASLRKIPELIEKLMSDISR